MNYLYQLELALYKLDDITLIGFILKTISPEFNFLQKKKKSHYNFCYSFEKKQFPQTKHPKVQLFRKALH